MIRLQDIADLVGVSRTTVSNVLHGKTSRVSKEKTKQISDLLEQEGYIANIGSTILTQKRSYLIGLVLWFDELHGFHALQDPFVAETLSSLEASAKAFHYHVIIIRTVDTKELSNIVNRLSIDGLIMLGYEGNRYANLEATIRKPMVLLDSYADGAYTFHNVGVDDYSGGYQAGLHLYECGYHNALYLAEYNVNGDYFRWLGFKDGQSQNRNICVDSRYLMLDYAEKERKEYYRSNLSLFLHAGALFFSADYLAIEAINTFFELGISVPDAISVVGFDDNLYCRLSRPKLTTVKQNVAQKAQVAFERLLTLINNEPFDDYLIRIPVTLVKRDSVKRNINL